MRRTESKELRKLKAKIKYYHELLAKRVKNPYSRKAKYRHRRILSPRKFAKKSFRVIPRGRKKLIVGCPKGYYRKGRCMKGMRVQSVLTRKKRRNGWIRYTASKKRSRRKSRNGFSRKLKLTKADRKRYGRRCVSKRKIGRFTVYTMRRKKRKGK